MARSNPAPTNYEEKVDTKRTRTKEGLSRRVVEMLTWEQPRGFDRGARPTRYVLMREEAFGGDRGGHRVFTSNLGAYHIRVGAKLSDADLKTIGMRDYQILLAMIEREKDINRALGRVAATARANPARRQANNQNYDRRGSLGDLAVRTRMPLAAYAALEDARTSGNTVMVSRFGDFFEARAYPPKRSTDASRSAMKALASLGFQPTKAHDDRRAGSAALTMDFPIQRKEASRANPRSTYFRERFTAAGRGAHGGASADSLLWTDPRTGRYFLLMADGPTGRALFQWGTATKAGRTWELDAESEETWDATRAPTFSTRTMRLIGDAGALVYGRMAARMNELTAKRRAR